LLYSRSWDSCGVPIFHNGTSLYEIKLGGEDCYHVVCKQTNAVEESDPAAARRNLRRAILGSRNRSPARLRRISHLVEFFGVAPTGQQSAGGLCALVRPFAQLSPIACGFWTLD